MTLPLRMKSGQPLEICPLIKRRDQMVLQVDFTSDAGILLFVGCISCYPSRSCVQI
jgi:hypothetical protein